MPKWSGYAIHSVIGAVLGAGIMALDPIAGVLAVFWLGVFGYIREKLQHPPFRDPLTLHQWMESLAWPAGALIGAGFSLWLRWVV